MPVYEATNHTKKNLWRNLRNCFCFSLAVLNITIYINLGPFHDTRLNILSECDPFTEDKKHELICQLMFEKLSIFKRNISILESIFPTMKF